MRLEQIKQYLSDGMFAVEPRFMDGLLATINSDFMEARAETDHSFTESHSYEVIGNIAVISIDGATTKKNSTINAMCGGFVGYDTIANYIAKAEGDARVEKILFHLDTVGGDVAGVDTLQELIKTSTKETITLYDNVGASAGIWYGTASDKVYATPMTQLGSIGVMAGYYEPREDDKKVVIVSKNAQNKNCTLNGDCKDKMQARIDQVESVFHSRVTSNTGLSTEEITKHFNSGDVISAQEALEIGFIDGITSKKDLLKTLATMPSNEKIANSNKGNTVTKQEEALQALLDTANTTIDAKQVEIDGKDKEIATLASQMATATAGEEKATKAHSDAVSAQALATKVTAMAFDMGVSAEVATEMLAQTTEDKAEIIALKAVQPVVDVPDASATTTGEETAPDTDSEKALSEENAQAMAEAIAQNL